MNKNFIFMLRKLEEQALKDSETMIESDAWLFIGKARAFKQIREMLEKALKEENKGIKE